MRDLSRVKITPLQLKILVKIPSLLSMFNKISHIRQYQFCTKFITGKKVLDAACGVGYGSEVLRCNNNHVTGVDINPENIYFAHMNFPKNKYKKCNIEDLKIFQDDDEKFDVVVSIQTLEHLWYPKKAVSEIYGVLKSGGMFIGSIPANCKHIMPQWAEAPDSYSFKAAEEILSHRFQKISWFFHYLISNDIRSANSIYLDTVTKHTGDFMFIAYKA